MEHGSEQVHWVGMTRLFGPLDTWVKPPAYIGPYIHVASLLMRMAL